MIGHTVRYRKIQVFPRGRFIRVIYIVHPIPPNLTGTGRSLARFRLPGKLVTYGSNTGNDDGSSSRLSKFHEPSSIPYPWVKTSTVYVTSIIVKYSNVEISVYNNAITLNSIVGCHFPKGWGPSHHLPQESYLSDFRLQTSNIPNFRDSGSETGQSQ